MSSSVFPEPAGAWTMNDVEVSSARSRAALSAIIFQLPNAAQRFQSAVIASVTFWVDLGMTGAEIVRELFQHSLPLGLLFAERKSRFHVHLLHAGRRDSRLRYTL